MSVKRPESARQEGKRPRFFVVPTSRDDLRMTTVVAKYARLVGSAAQGAVTGQYRQHHYRKRDEFVALPTLIGLWQSELYNALKAIELW